MSDNSKESGRQSSHEYNKKTRDHENVFERAHLRAREHNPYLVSLVEQLEDLSKRDSYSNSLSDRVKRRLLEKDNEED